MEEVVSWTSGSEAVFAEEPESKVWGERQESMVATWCTQDTVQRGAQPFFGKKFAMALLVSVLHQRDAGISALLGAIMDQAVFADVEVA